MPVTVPNLCFTLKIQDPVGSVLPIYSTLVWKARQPPSPDSHQPILHPQPGGSPLHPPGHPSDVLQPCPPSFLPTLAFSLTPQPGQWLSPLPVTSRSCHLAMVAPALPSLCASLQCLTYSGYTGNEWEPPFTLKRGWPLACEARPDTD